MTSTGLYIIALVVFLVLGLVMFVAGSLRDDLVLAKLDISLPEELNYINEAELNTLIRKRFVDLQEDQRSVNKVGLISVSDEKSGEFTAQVAGVKTSSNQLHRFIRTHLAFKDKYFIHGSIVVNDNRDVTIVLQNRTSAPVKLILAGEDLSEDQKTSICTAAAVLLHHITSDRSAVITAHNTKTRWGRKFAESISMVLIDSNVPSDRSFGLNYLAALYRINLRPEAARSLYSASYNHNPQNFITAYSRAQLELEELDHGAADVWIQKAYNSASTSSEKQLCAWLEVIKAQLPDYKAAGSSKGMSLQDFVIKYKTVPGLYSSNEFADSIIMLFHTNQQHSQVLAAFKPFKSSGRTFSEQALVSIALSAWASDSISVIHDLRKSHLAYALIHEDIEAILLIQELESTSHYNKEKEEIFRKLRGLSSKNQFTSEVISSITSSMVAVYAAMFKNVDPDLNGAVNEMNAPSVNYVINDYLSIRSSKKYEYPWHEEPFVRGQLALQGGSRSPLYTVYGGLSPSQ